MSGKIKIAIDAMGGENAPNKVIDGISKFIEINFDFNKTKKIINSY